MAKNNCAALFYGLKTSVFAWFSENNLPDSTSPASQKIKTRTAITLARIMR